MATLRDTGQHFSTYWYVNLWNLTSILKTNMKLLLFFTSALLISQYSTAQKGFDGLYSNLQKNNNLDSSNHTYTLTYLKISGTRCFMDITTVLINGVDTNSVKTPRFNIYFRGSYTLLSGKISIMLQEVIVDNYERNRHINLNGIPVPQRELKYLFGESLREGLYLDKLVFKRITNDKTLTSEDLCKF